MTFYDYPPYVSVGERKAKSQKALEKLKEKNSKISPVIILGKTIATTWWGKSWNSNLARYADYSSRIDRGRSYLRHGAVLDLQIQPGKVKALVQGRNVRPYKIEIKIDPLSSANWKAITKACADNLGSMEELISGNFPKALSELFNTKGGGLFPSPKEISFHCSCPDWADMCKHSAAVLYGIGARLDEDPKLFFILRNIDIEELIFKTVQESSKGLIENSKKKSGRILQNTNISDVFGIDLEDNTVKPISKKIQTKKVQSRKVQSKKVQSKKVQSKKVQSKKVQSKKVQSKKGY